MKSLAFLIFLSFFNQAHAYEEKRILFTLDKETKDRMLKNMRNYLRITNDMIEILNLYVRP